ncbi:podoplanin isoform X2 [Phascolarctos cinereus]|uniref:Podoplanin isoform X2 n=1 Tax=Phascolarctos cinereus TaxID=38626 RepID=A0A6P5J4B7_PHACI|nr:podoplanin isoform X2 [Phascolarctos cinereus]
MWHFQILLLVLGSSPLWVITEASTTLPEDGMTTAVSSDWHPRGSDDASTPLPPRTIRPHHTTGADDKPTPEPTVHSRENSTDSRVITDHPSEKVGGETKTATEKGGLETVALVGIILGIVIAIGIIAGIVIAVVRKMSGRP